MKNKLFVSLLLTVTMTLTMGAGFTFAAHPDIPLYTYEEVAMQMGGVPQNQADFVSDNFAGFPVEQRPLMPVYINPANGVGLPFSPKMTCGN